MSDAVPTKRGLVVPEWLWGLGFVSPWVIGFVSFMVLPIVLSVWYSFTDYSLIQKPFWIGLDNYTALMHDGVFWKVVLNTLIYAGVAVPLGTVVALVIASLLAARIRFVGFYRAAVFVPTLVPMVASAMIWMWLFNGELGLINRTLDAVGVRGPNWLGDSHFVMASLVVMSLWGVGQAVVIYTAALQDVPKVLYEAADLDGFGVVGRFVHVTLPMISPVILFNVIIAIIATWQVFAVPYIMLGGTGGPDQAGYFYTMYLYDKAFPFGQMGYASALAWIQTLIILALTALTFAVSRRTVYYAG